MNIKGSLNTFQELSKAHNADEFQKQIKVIQENIEKCKRNIDNFDVYHITCAIADLNDIDAVKARLLPGEAAVISAPSQGKWHTGQLIVRINDLEYVEVEPFQTGTYYPSSMQKMGDSPNYRLNYSFSANPPKEGKGELASNAEKLSSPYEEIYTTLQLPEEAYYYGFSNTENNTFLIPLRDGITFVQRETRPILKFFITNDEQYYEEIGFSDYRLEKEDQNYKIVLTGNFPNKCYVAIK